MSESSIQLKKTKIVCTIGPSSNDEETLERLIRAGMNVARLNLSHGSLDYHKKTFDLIRSIDESIAILLDISGPKIRVGKFEKSIVLQKGQEYILTKENVTGNEERASVTYPQLIDDLQEGSLIYLNDGLIAMRVIAKNDDYLVAKVLNGGILSSNKGINVPESKISVYTPTDKDRKDILETAKWEPDYYSVSFVRRVLDLENVRNTFRTVTNDDIPLVSKIEHKDALNAFEDIVSASQGVMVARGDLGVELPPEEVPLLQKELIRKSRYHGVPVIVATQMLESMIINSRPTRAEVSDVANAILDGADAVMLSAETATGKYPVETVEMMTKICLKTECHLTPTQEERHVKKGAMVPAHIGRAAVRLAEDTNADLIIAMTQTGTTTEMVSTFRPKQAILGFSTNLKNLRRLALQWGVIPILFDFIPDTDDMILKAILTAYEKKYIERSSKMVIVAGTLLGLPSSTNLIQYHVAEEILRSIEAQKEFRKAYNL